VFVAGGIMYSIRNKDIRLCNKGSLINITSECHVYLNKEQGILIGEQKSYCNNNLEILVKMY
jgi:hypothetical protein